VFPRMRRPTASLVPLLRWMLIPYRVKSMGVV
jgi:hypothetical protein